VNVDSLGDWISWIKYLSCVRYSLNVRFYSFSSLHRHTGHFFLWGGAESFLPERYVDSARKTARPMLTCKFALPDSPHLIILEKNPGFRALHLAGRKEFRFFV